MTGTATSVAGDGVPRFRGHGRRLHVCGEVAGIWHAHRRRPLAFVLVGTDQVRVFVRARRRFRSLIEECDNHG